jgi:two-component system KDP operon response regulator KdpE
MTDNRPVVLIIDDEAQVRRFLKAGFGIENFAVLEAETGEEGLRAARLRNTDLVIVDLNLPDQPGREVVKRIRTWSDVPIIVLSVRSDDTDKVGLLEAGADDYVVKPFSMAELLARTRAALRRHSRSAKGEHIVRIGDLKIDLANRAIYRDEERVSVSPKEYRLLQMLAQHAGNVVTHGVLMKDIWGQAHLENLHYLRILVRKLRRKIERDPKQPRLLISEHGVGYRLSGDAG